MKFKNYITEVDRANQIIHRLLLNLTMNIYII